MFKKLFTCITTLAICFILSNNTLYAQENINSWTAETDEDGTMYLANEQNDEKIYATFKIVNGECVSTDLLEIMDELNSIPAIAETQENILPISGREVPNSNYKLYRWVKTGTAAKITGSAIKVSADVLGPGNVTHSTSATVGESFSIQVGVTSDITKTMKVNAGVTWNTSLSTGSTSGSSFSVPSGKIGYIQFNPYLYKVTGDTYEDTYNPIGTVIATKNIGLSYGYTPIKLSNGLADGLYSYVQK